MRYWMAVAAALGLAACSAGENTTDQAAAAAAADSTPAANAAEVERPAGADGGPRTELPPNELGRIPILEYHLIGAENGRWTVTAEQLRADMQLLWERGYRPITMIEYLDRSFDLPAGTSPVVFTFDDASPGQFRYLEKGGELEIDPQSAVGVWLDFAQSHPGWGNKGVFCVLSGSEAGRAFFGDKGIEGQKTEWRHRKIKFLVDQGFEVCNHTLWHATLSKYPDAFVQEQIARLQLAVDSAAPGYRIRTFALPLGEWPKNRALAHEGSWTDPKSGKTVTYQNDAILRVAGGPAPGPHAPDYDPLRLTRVQVYANELQRTLDALDRDRSRYVSDGNPEVVAKPAGEPPADSAGG